MLHHTPFIVLAVLAVQGAAGAAPVYDHSPFAMNGIGAIHGRNDPELWGKVAKRARAMKEAGIHWDRPEMWWGIVEPEKDKFDWTFSDRMVQFYKEHRLHGMPILSYFSAWSNNTPPHDDAERARYANYVYKVVSRYKDTFKVWEVWNEPNIPTFWPSPNVKDYTLMLKEAYKAAKRADPTCTIIAAATSGPGNDFIMGIHEHGGWDYCDAISIHPYSMAGGPVAQRLDKIIRILNKQMAATGKPKPLWITEMGWMTNWPDDFDSQAIYLVQSHAIAFANGVEKLFWFCFDNFDNWGLVRGCEPFDPKPSYHAYKLMASHFGSPGPAALFEGYLKMPKGAAGYLFTKADGKRFLLLWSNDGDPIPVQLAQRSGLTAVDVFGKAVEVSDGRISVGRAPVFVTGVDGSRIGRVSRELNPFIERKGENLINNGSLDIIHGKNPGWWSPGRFFGTDNKGAFAVSDEGRGGSKAVSISQSTSPAAWDATPVPVEPGKTYRITAWIKTKDATGDNQAAVLWYTGSQWPCIGAVRTETVTGTRDWTRVTASGVAPKDACLARVNFVSENNTGTAWFDDAVLEEE